MNFEWLSNSFSSVIRPHFYFLTMNIDTVIWLEMPENEFVNILYKSRSIFVDIGEGIG